MPSGPVVDLSRSVVLSSPEITGDVSIFTADGRTLTGGAIAGTPIPFGSRIVTGPSGHLRVTLPDGSIFTLGSGGELAIDEFFFDPDPGLRRITVNLVKGFFRWVSAKTSGDGTASSEIGKPHVRFSVGTIGFRGTDCELVQEPGGAGYVKLYEGEVAIYPYDTNDEIVLHSGQMITFDENGKLGEPAPMPDGTG